MHVLSARRSESSPRTVERVGCRQHGSRRLMEFHADTSCSTAEAGAARLDCRTWCKIQYASDHCLKCNCQHCGFCGEVLAKLRPRPPPPPRAPPPCFPPPWFPPPPRPPAIPLPRPPPVLPPSLPPLPPSPPPPSLPPYPPQLWPPWPPLAWPPLAGLRPLDSSPEVRLPGDSLALRPLPLPSYLPTAAYAEPTDLAPESTVGLSGGGVVAAWSGGHDSMRTDASAAAPARPADESRTEPSTWVSVGTDVGSSRSAPRIRVGGAGTLGGVGGADASTARPLRDPDNATKGTTTSLLASVFVGHRRASNSLQTLSQPANDASYSTCMTHDMLPIMSLLMLLLASVCLLVSTAVPQTLHTRCHVKSRVWRSRPH